ncbi:hypothetical protein A2U01_0087135, partial [Trifolium medium]|nr:hypothetical protein [Trifolium medium]
SVELSGMTRVCCGVLQSIFLSPRLISSLGLAELLCSRLRPARSSVDARRK